MIKIKGHAAHAMFVHFPSALFPLEFLSHGAYLIYTDSRLAVFSYCALILGTVLGWMAALIGLIDLLQLSEVPENQSQVKLGIKHGGLQGITLSVYTVLMFVQFKHFDSQWLLGWQMLVIKLPLVTGLILSNFFGAELLLKILKKEWVKRN